MSKKMKKILLGTGIGVASFLVIAAIILMILFIPVKGVGNSDEYWSEYDEFKIDDIKTLDVKNDNFKILQITDLHYHLPHKTNENDYIVRTLVEENNPDMIVITGDSVFGPTNLIYTQHLVKLMDSFKIPWAIVYGNHDDEGKVDKFWMGDKYINAEYCLYENGPYNIGGTGNYIVNLNKDGKPFYSMIMMDSNRSITYKGNQEYGAFTPSQVSWYEWAARGLTNAGYDKSMMFFHIPFPEYLDAYESWESTGFDESIGFGERNEDVCSATYNPGMFSKIKEMGNTTHTFVGHDHVNNFSVKYEGIVLSYGLKSSRQFAYSEELIGGTLITINADRSVDIEHKYVEV